MPFHPIQSEKLSAAVVRQIELLILRGILRPGERLPAERDLAERLGVSRPSLREAVGELQEKGLLASRAGSGIYVAEVLGSAFSPALVRLFGDHSEAVTDYLAFRRDMEGLAAERAARHASDLDLQVIDQAYERMADAARREAKEEADLDAAFHMAIIEAGHNIVMLHMMRAMYDLLRQGVFYNRARMFAQNTTRADLLSQHSAINTALQSRDPAGARTAVEKHMDYIASAYAAQEKADRNAEVTRQRIEHEAKH
ncbi:FadR/GntR family transcriptional regulator [Rhodalgimonas zhirmunskyi]|uniref:Pyruvate dehydrogenase complex repressor n=1 Tax=Rhodalgimonas zhirmunskyi TaxID=2964767 RepID=A0AAJ1UAH9_9RHOB|nr:FadR/GntR family transcriptional regulator [Rhodoalgimonas zhirmunskyi]MDQ2095825.1 FadR family transcriptional regulator [Rhodoalgimonas zhirmunskyi]